MKRWNSINASVTRKTPKQKPVWCVALVVGPAELNSSVVEKSMRRPLSPQLQSVQALLPTQGMLRPHFVGRLCRRDVYLRVFAGTLSCQRTHTQEEISHSQSCFSNNRSASQSYYRRTGVMLVTVGFSLGFFHLIHPQQIQLRIMSSIPVRCRYNYTW